MSTPISPDHLALQCLYYWESAQPSRIALTQPMGNGQVKTFTWGQVADETRRMATFLKAQGWPEGSKVALLSKNCAWWLMTDLAIWMAGYVSVPLYPTLAAGTVQQILEHSEAKACFIGKLDGWEGMKPGVPAGMPCFSYALSPDDVKATYQSWDEVVADTSPMIGKPVRGGHYGKAPLLTDLDENGNMKHTTDFRQVYASLIEGWLDYADSKSLLSGQFTTFPLFI